MVGTNPRYNPRIPSRRMVLNVPKTHYTLNFPHSTLCLQSSFDHIQGHTTIPARNPDAAPAMVISWLFESRDSMVGGGISPSFSILWTTGKWELLIDEILGLSLYYIGKIRHLG